MKIFFRNKQLVIVSATIMTGFLTLYLSSQLDLKDFKTLLYLLPIIPAFFMIYYIILILNEAIIINFYSEVLENKGVELASKMLRENYSIHQSTTNDLVERSALNCMISFLQREERNV